MIDKYPKIPYFSEEFYDRYCWVFDKLDGTNIKVYWNKKRGWWKFGTKSTNFIDADSPYVESLELFWNNFSNELEKIIKKNFNNHNDIVFFFEFHGKNSFAGSHIPNENKELTLIDVYFKDGWLHPKDFINIFTSLPTPKLIKKCFFTEELINEIRNDKKLKEGVVCKGFYNKKYWVCKVKTDDWINKVKSLYSKEKLFDELNKDKKLMELYDKEN